MLRATVRSILVALSLGLAACSHYRLGTESAPKFATLHVEVVKSEALLPQAVAVFTTELREAFIKDGRLQLVNDAAAADATLSVTLEQFDRGVAVVRPDDTGLARRFDLALTARATLVDNRSREFFFNGRTLTAKRGAFTDSGLIQAEYQTLPLLAAQLAEQVRGAVLDTW